MWAGWWTCWRRAPSGLPLRPAWLPTVRSPSPLPDPATGKFTHDSFLGVLGWAPNAVLMIAASGRPIEDAQKQPLGTLNAFAGYIVGCAVVFPFSVLSFQLHDGCWYATCSLSCVPPFMPTPSPATGVGGPASSHSRNWATTIGKLFRPRSSRPGGCSASCTCGRALSATPASPDQSARPPLGP